MTVKKLILSEERNVTLTAYLQEVEGELGFSRRPAMLVLPGGTDDVDGILAGLQNGEITRTELEECAGRVLALSKRLS